MGAPQRRVHDDTCYVCLERRDATLGRVMLDCPECVLAVHVMCLPEIQRPTWRCRPRCAYGHYLLGTRVATVTYEFGKATWEWPTSDTMLFLFLFGVASIVAAGLIWTVSTVAQQLGLAAVSFGLNLMSSAGWATITTNTVSPLILLATLTLATDWLHVVPAAVLLACVAAACSRNDAHLAWYGLATSVAVSTLLGPPLWLLRWLVCGFFTGLLALNIVLELWHRVRRPPELQARFAFLNSPPGDV